jgi:hypothetical protein
MTKKGYKITKEHRRNLSLSHIGKSHPASEKQKRLVRERRLGKPLSEETKKKLSLAHKGKRTSPKTEFKKGVYQGFGFKPGSKLSEEHKKKIGESLMGHKTSKQTREKIRQSHLGKRLFKNIGDQNGKWKGGVTHEHDLIRRTDKYKNWRSEVYERDGWRCIECHQKCQAMEIVAHHIKSFADYPESRFEVSNGITLCRSCHLKIHQKLKP